MYHEAVISGSFLGALLAAGSSMPDASRRLAMNDYLTQAIDRRYIVVTSNGSSPSTLSMSALVSLHDVHSHYQGFEY